MAAAADQVGEGGDAAGGTLGSSSLSAGAKLSSPCGVVVDQLGEGGDTVGGAPGSSSRVSAPSLPPCRVLLPTIQARAVTQPLVPA
ncbi:hypothetical protein OsI_12111 [Oryza sativa Indica Group]|jgi:hypothetical protein|uniref:Uncharacterized protein n=1 Tax=Oryza sativa subsp. indica TaxID=39946 RepID=B8AK53_ORYSI|nr:hypothetical protein OsI_12111 [Oryza sativa Indica Group]